MAHDAVANGGVAHDVVAIGASVGGLEVLIQLLQRLPGDLPATLLVVVHRGRTGSLDRLPEILQRSTRLAVVPALDGERPQHACVYVGAPGEHFRVFDGRLRVGEDLGVRPSRASIDMLFRSAAAEYGSRVVAVVLSGALNDGTAGLWDVRRAGGITMVQDPSLAEHPSMPGSAMHEVPVHFCLSIPRLAEALVALTTGAAPAPNRPRVLIVEDELVLALHIAAMLRDVGYEVIGSVSTGEDAMRAAGEFAPDVVVMDIQLAGPMRGIEAARALWQRFRMPLVYLTSYSDEGTLHEAAATPCGFVLKPCRAPQLHAAIQIALHHHHRP